MDDAGHWPVDDPAGVQALRDAGAHSLLVVPLALRGTLLGLLALARCRASPAFEHEDIGLAGELAAHTALCLDNARRYARERALAATVQRRLLPQRPVAHTGLDTAYAYQPGRSAGGSWFDVIRLSSSRTLLVIGQVTGEGIHAATAMGQLRTAVHALAALDLETADLLARLNDTVLQLAHERGTLPTADAPHGEPFTAAHSYVAYDPVTLTCTAGRAGLPPPLLAHPDGTVSPLELPDGPRLGSTDVTPFAATTLGVAEDSVLVLATPALLDAVDPEHIRHLLSGSEASVQDLCDSIVYASDRSRPTDGDAILVLARSHALPADRTAAWRLEADHEAPAFARALTCDWLTGRQLPDEAVFAAEVIVSELVTNAVRYGIPPVHLRLILDRTLTLEVSDGSSTSPHLRHARATDEGGRGLFIISQLADHWGTRHRPDGKTIWAELRLSTSTTS
ncbi:ATP-binding SpoIIE family protein phosphatase [Streptomyces sp. NPDC020362]|uniref:ATP-binding SpoIIE family protein phosphatase n=1 Tax=unclassified Streptomyces TaxID=2593676 RepID=UPI0033F70B35